MNVNVLKLSSNFPFVPETNYNSIILSDIFVQSLPCSRRCHHDIKINNSDFLTVKS